MKKQVLLIHGGNCFNSYEEYIQDLSEMKFDIQRSSASKNRWNRNLDKFLGDKFEVAMPQMPCKQNAKYLEWKILFEKMIPFLRNRVVLIGHSLGGIFLAKYLSENELPVKVKAVFLVAPPSWGFQSL
jgi:predicted alpha/beta hydrolase family esterase